MTAIEHSVDVRLHNGTPTVHVDGQPTFYYAAWFPAPEPGHITEFRKVVAATARRLGTHLYTYENGTGRLGVPGPYLIPGPGGGRDTDWDFTVIDHELGQFVEADPEARFQLRLLVEMNVAWWAERHPDECLVTDAGRQPEQSFASVVWREQVKAFLEALIAHLARSGMAERVLAYQVNAGTTCEWFKYALNFGSACGDYSPPMVRAFRAWLRRRYADDVGALQAAWSRADVTFDNALVPAPEAQLGTCYPRADGAAWPFGTYRNPRVEQPVIDYQLAMAELQAEVIIDFCQTVKEASGGRAMAGAFFGYWMGFAVNSDYFRDSADSNALHTRLQRTGHLGLQRVLESPAVDFLASPMEYAFRGIGGHSPVVLLADAARAHGKLVIQENDDRSWHPTSRDYGACRTADDFLAVYRRTQAEAMVNGYGVWSVSLPAHVQRAECIGGPLVGLAHAAHVEALDPVDCNRVLDEFAVCHRLGEFALHTDRTPQAEIAVLVDDESFCYQTYFKNLELPLLALQNVQHFPRIGAPVELHTLNDFLAGRLRPFKLYLFMNAFRLDEERRGKLASEIRRDGRVALWMCAPGLIKDDVSVNHMAEVTGMRFRAMTPPWGPCMHVTDFTHPITRDLSEGQYWGTDLNLAPVFAIQDPEATILGHVMYSQGRCAEGFGLRQFGEWTSIYMAAPNVPASVLRGIARFAGVHLYSEAGDVLYASRELLAVHTLKGGRRTFALPEKVDVVYDLFKRQVLGRQVDRFDATLERVSTAMYYAGRESLMARLGKP